jgi:hypothetical protein
MRSHRATEDHQKGIKNDITRQMITSRTKDCIPISVKVPPDGLLMMFKVQDLDVIRNIYSRLVPSPHQTVQGLSGLDLDIHWISTGYLVDLDRGIYQLDTMDI